MKKQLEEKDKDIKKQIEEKDKKITELTNKNEKENNNYIKKIRDLTKQLIISNTFYDSKMQYLRRNQLFRH